MKTITGKSLQYLDRFVGEHFEAGDKVELFLGVGRALTQQEVATFQDELVSQGAQMTSPVDYGYTEDLGHTLRVEFIRPDMQGGVGFPVLLPLILVGGLAAIAVTSIIGWRMSQVIETFAKYLLPIAFIAAGTIIGISYFQSKKGSPQKAKA